MKIAISASGKSLENNVSEIFARCPYFVVVEIKDGKIDKTEILENKGANQMGGAGIAVAQLMAEKEVNAVITGNVGPRAFEILRQFGIEIYRGQGKIKEVIEKFLEEKLEKFE